MTKNSRQLSKYLRPLGDLSMVWVQGGDGQKKAQYLWCLTSVKAEFVIWSQWLWICYELHMVCVSKHFQPPSVLWSNEFIDTSTNRTSDTASLFLAVSLECICNGFLDLRSTPVYVCRGFSNPSPVATLTPIGLLHRPSSPLHWHESSRTQPESINIVRELEKRNLQENVDKLIILQCIDDYCPMKPILTVFVSFVGFDTPLATWLWTSSEDETYWRRPIAMKYIFALIWGGSTILPIRSVNTRRDGLSLSQCTALISIWMERKQLSG